MGTARKTSKRAAAWILGALTVLVIAVLAIGMNGDDDQPAAAPTPTPTSSATAYIAALSGINGALVSNEKAAVDNGENICLDIEQDKTTAEVEKNTKARFEVDVATARKIVAITKANLCSAAG